MYQKHDYVAPKTERMDIHFEGLICSSYTSSSIENGNNRSLDDEYYWD